MENIRIKKVRDVKTPDRGHSTDAGLDFYIPNDRTITIHPDDNVKIPSGVIMEIPKGWMGLFLNKSSIASKHDLLVGAQVVDHGYTGELHICLHNVGNYKVVLKPGSKVVQMVFLQIPTPTPFVVEEVNMNTDRGSNGFGSTNKYYCTICKEVEVNNPLDKCVMCQNILYNEGC